MALVHDIAEGCSSFMILTMIDLFVFILLVLFLFYFSSVN